MNISELILPSRVKLNNNFKLEDSVDVETIIYVYDITYLGDNIYQVLFKLLASDLSYNLSIANNHRIWFDENRTPTLNYFEANTLKDDSEGNLLGSLFVMADDDCFDLITDKKMFYLPSEVKQKFLTFVKDEKIKQMLNNEELLSTWLDLNI